MPATDRHGRRAVLIAALVLCGLVAWHTWMAEDALITFRTIDHWVNGRGLTWNPGERVQAYTHPLWMFILSIVYFFSRKPYPTAVIACWLATAAFVGLLAFTKRARTRPWSAFAALVLLSGATGFLEFSTSGLENALSHLLLCAFVILASRERPSLFGCSLALALVLANRIDTALLILPWWLLIAGQHLRDGSRLRAVRDVALGLAPFAAWEIFSFVYYGVWVPNTALAKLGTGLSPGANLMRGLTFYEETIVSEPATVLALVGLAGLVAFTNTRARWVVLAGTLLHLAYIAFIGGDFMRGRFFTPTLACLAASSVWIDHNDLSPRVALASIAAFLVSIPNLRNSTATFRTLFDPVPDHGVVDERAFYPQSWLFGAPAGEVDRTPRWREIGANMRARNATVMSHVNVGYLGYYADPNLYIIDKVALTDPFLARLPTRRDQRQRAGHFYRLLPPGYGETLATHECQMEPRLCQLFDDVWKTTHAPLWDRDRWAAMRRLHSGVYTSLATDESLMWQRPVVLTEEARGAISADHPLTVSNHGVMLTFDPPRSVRSIAITFDAGTCFKVQAKNFARRVCPRESAAERFIKMTVEIHQVTPQVIVNYDFGTVPGRLYGFAVDSD